MIASENETPQPGICLGCGAITPTPDGATPDPTPSEHRGQCPPWRCDDCGEMCSAADLCSCWIRPDQLPLADIKALFAGDGTFNVGPDGRVTVAEPLEGEWQ